jgi:hypothetical protein
VQVEPERQPFEQGLVLEPVLFLEASRGRLDPVPRDPHRPTDQRALELEALTDPVAGVLALELERFDAAADPCGPVDADLEVLVTHAKLQLPLTGLVGVGRHALVADLQRQLADHDRAGRRVEADLLWRQGEEQREREAHGAQRAGPGATATPASATRRTQPGLSMNRSLTPA